MSAELNEYVHGPASEPGDVATGLVAQEAAGVPPVLVLGVIDHESGGVWTAAHHNSNGTTDAGLMQVALENLLRNSWKYTSKNLAARIEFGFRRIGSQVTYFVKDNGAGFNPEFADRLFKPFQRLHTQGEFAGTGVGLATVQRIISRHGGRIWAEGAVDQGATFYFVLDA